jgi:hypothetical protein
MKTAALILAGLSLAVLVLSAALNLSSAAEPQPGSDEAWRQKMLGSWSEGETPYGISTFLPGGVYRLAIYLSPEKREVLMTAEGKWWIEGGRLYNKADKIDMLVPLRVVPIDVDKTVVDIIVDITDDTMRLIDESGKEYENKRVPGEGKQL